MVKNAVSETIVAPVMVFAAAAGMAFSGIACNGVLGRSCDAIGADIANILPADGSLPRPLGPDGIAGTLDDDLRLMSNSPAIDGGDNELLPDDTLDVDRDGDTAEKTPLDLEDAVRIQGGTVDMGAYEAR